MSPFSTILRIISLLLIFPGSLTVFGQNRDSVQTPATIPELKTAIEKVLEETNTPAVGLAMVEGDSTIWVAGLGMANLENQSKATENTMFRIGSTSKLFVSLAVLKLQEEGRLSLNDKVRDLIPEIEFNNPWQDKAPILVSHLLEHTTGWDDLHLTEFALNDPKLTLKEALDFHPHSRTSRWMPGTRMSYSNSGPPVAAYIVEKITGTNFEDYIQNNFFDPMGMESMTYLNSEVYQEFGATLYLNEKPQPYWNIGVRPSGSINASPKDMTKMLRFFTNRGLVDSIRLITEASVQRMETPMTSSGARAGLEYGYGLSNYSSPHKNFVYRAHNGGVNGGLTDFAYLAEHRIGYVVMINAGNGNALHRITQLIRDYQTNGLITDPVSAEDHPAVTDPAIEGHYVTINPRMQMAYHLERIINIKKFRIQKNGDLYTKNLFGGWAQHHVPFQKGKYISPETRKVSLVQVNEPLAGEVVHEGSLVLKPISSILVYGQLSLLALWLLYMTASLFIGSFYFIAHWRGRKFRMSHVSLGLWPFLASVFFLTEIIFEYLGAQDPRELLGTVNFVSVSIMLITLGFAFAAIWSVINLIRKRNVTVNPTIYWHLVILSGLHLFVAIYLFSHGIIGLQTWG